MLFKAPFSCFFIFVLFFTSKKRINPFFIRKIIFTFAVQNGL